MVVLISKVLWDCMVLLEKLNLRENETEILTCKIFLNSLVFGSLDDVLE